MRRQSKPASHCQAGFIEQLISGIYSMVKWVRRLFIVKRILSANWIERLFGSVLIRSWSGNVYRQWIQFMSEDNCLSDILYPFFDPNEHRYGPYRSIGLIILKRLVWMWWRWRWMRRKRIVTVLEIELAWNSLLCAIPIRKIVMLYFEKSRSHSIRSVRYLNSGNIND